MKNVVVFLIPVRMLLSQQKTFEMAIAGLYVVCRVALTRTFSSAVNSFSKRTRNCGELRLENVGERVKLYGWLDNKRMDKFIVLRDAYGAVQAVLPKGMKEQIQSVNVESALSIEGLVEDRGRNRMNKFSTGEIEVKVERLEVLNSARSPIPVFDTSNEQTRLTHRYLDLRSTSMQRALRLRANIISRMRRHLEDECGFIDVQTPTLAHFTPGGASEFPVPANSSAECFSLPQSPQIYKQLLMCGAIDRYYQVAICYRDEKAKPDRQPEFTQLDLEASFTDQESIMALVERIIVRSWPDELPPKPKYPFLRMSFQEAMERFGSDKPDVRIPWEIQKCPKEFTRSDKIGQRKNVKYFVAQGAARIMTPENMAIWRAQIDKLPYKQEFAVLDSRSSFPEFASFLQTQKIHSEDAVVVCWGDEALDVCMVLGYLRNCLADSLGLKSANRFEFLWVQNFPLFTKNEENRRLESTHHPFTAPIPRQLEQLSKGEDLEEIEAQHYDLVLNGVEIGGGSIRIHDADLQRYVLEDLLGLGVEHLEHFLTALSYGAPPHGGFALGLDRFVAILNAGGNSNVTIRDVMAFPKASVGKCLMTGAPVQPAKRLLHRYGLSTIK